MCHPEEYSEPCQTFKMERFAKIVDDFQLLTIFIICSILDIWEGCEYTYDDMTDSVFAYWTKLQREYIPINLWRFLLRDSSDKDCVFAGLNKVFA